MSLQLVIIGVILLIVLAVVLYIFGSNIWKQNKLIGGEITKLNDSKNDPSSLLKQYEPKDGKSLLPIVAIGALPTIFKKKKKYKKI